MFGMKKFFKKDEPARDIRQNNLKVGVQLMGSLLVCYPEVTAINYDPEKDWLELSFMVRKPVPEGRKLDDFLDFLRESLEVYHEMEEGLCVWSSVSLDEQHDTLMIQVVRNLGDLSRGELEVMAELMVDRFGDSLLVDRHTEENLPLEFANMHSEILDQLLDQPQELAIKERIAAVRENDRVVVYNR